MTFPIKACYCHLSVRTLESCEAFMNIHSSLNQKFALPYGDRLTSFRLVSGLASQVRPDAGRLGQFFRGLARLVSRYCFKFNPSLVSINLSDIDAD